MQAHEERVVVELNELAAKREKLGVFVDSERFKGLPVAEQSRMIRQFEIMQKYEEVLQERIDNFPK